MLNPVEFVEVTAPRAPVRLAVDDAWPRPKTVLVHSKGQVPYLFRPCLDPCSPHERPYNLQALRGTENYDDILAWYCKRNPAVSRGDLDQLVAEVIHCVGDRQISVEIHHDMDTQERFPWFLVWGFAKEPSDDEDRVTDAFRDSWLASPLVHIVMASFRSGSFENRHVSDWS